MSDTEPKTDDIEKTDDVDLSGEPETPSKKAPLIDITTEEGRTTLFEMRCIAMGVDPKGVQSLAKFSDFDKIDEGTYYPNQITSVAIAQLRMYGEGLYKKPQNPFSKVADFLGDGFKGYKGFKSNQYVEITSGQQNLDKLQGMPEDVKKSVLSGLLNRGKSE